MIAMAVRWEDVESTTVPLSWVPNHIPSSLSSSLLIFRCNWLMFGPSQKKGRTAPQHYSTTADRRGVVDRSIAAFLQFFGPQQMDAFLRVGLQAQGSAPW